jgi:hypothetical protein
MCHPTPELQRFVAGRGMSKSEVLARQGVPDGHESTLASSGQRLRPCDREALHRMRDRGPLTIPQAYDCGHSHNETTGHGMNRLVAAQLAAFHGWDPRADDALWVLTNKGKFTLSAMEHDDPSPSGA